MKIYLAGSCGSERRSYMVSVGEELRTLGFEVYCPFELKIDNAWDMSQEDWAQKVFDNDILAINSCDVMVMVTPGRQSTAGTNWEQGYAYALDKKITREATFDSADYRYGIMQNPNGEDAQNMGGKESGIKALYDAINNA